MAGIERDTEVQLGNLSEAEAAEVTAASNVKVTKFHETKHVKLTEDDVEAVCETELVDEVSVTEDVDIGKATDVSEVTTVKHKECCEERVDICDTTVLKNSNEGIVKIGDNLAEIAVKEEDQEVSCNSKAKDKEVETLKQDIEAHAEAHSDEEVGKECLSNLDKVKINGDIREASIERDTDICSEQEAEKVCDKTMVEDCEKEILKSKAAEILNVHRKVIKIDDQEVKVNVTQMVLQRETARVYKQERVECVGEVLVPLSNTGVAGHSDKDAVTASSINEGMTTEMSSNEVNLASEAVTETHVLGEDTKTLHELEEDCATKNMRMNELEDFGSTEEEGPVTESSDLSTEMASTSETDEEIDDPYLYFEFSSSFDDTSESADPDNTLVFKGKSEDNVLVNKLPRIPQYMLFPSLSDPQKPARTVTFSPYIKFQLIPARNVESDFSSSPEPSTIELPLQVSDASIEGESDGDLEAASTEDEESAEMSVGNIHVADNDKGNETQELRADVSSSMEWKKDVICEIDSLVAENKEVDMCYEEVFSGTEIEVNEKPEEVHELRDVEITDEDDIIQVNDFEVADDIFVPVQVTEREMLQLSDTGASGLGDEEDINVSSANRGENKVSEVNLADERVTETQVLDGYPLQIGNIKVLSDSEATKNIKMNEPENLGSIEEEDSVRESSGSQTEMASSDETGEEVDDQYLYFEFSSSFGDTSESTDPDNTLVFKGKSEDNVLVNKPPRIQQYVLFPSLSDPQKPARTVTFSPYINFQLIPARNVESDFSSSPESSPIESPLQVSSDASIQGKSDGDAIEAASTEDEESAEIKVNYCGESELVNETQVLRTDEKVMQAVEIKDGVCEIDSVVKENNEVDICDEEVISEREAEVDEKQVKVCKIKNVEVHDMDIIQVRDIKIVDDSAAAQVCCKDAVQASGSGNGKNTGMNFNTTDFIVESEENVELEELDANSLQIRDSSEIREADSDNAEKAVKRNDAGDFLNQNKRISSCKTNGIRSLENEEIDLETARERQSSSLDSCKLDKPKVS